MGGRIAVGVSGSGSNLRALAARIARGALDAEIALVFADRACPAIAWAEEAGLETAVIPDLGAREPAARAAGDAVLAATVAAARGRCRRPGRLHAPRRTGPAGGLPGPGPQRPPVAPAGVPRCARGPRRAGGGRRRDRRHRPPRRRIASTAARSSLAEAVPILAGDTEEALLERLHAVEHRLLPRAVGLLLAGALGSTAGG